MTALIQLVHRYRSTLIKHFRAVFAVVTAYIEAREDVQSQILATDALYFIMTYCHARVAQRQGAILKSLAEAYWFIRYEVVGGQLRLKRFSEVASGNTQCNQLIC
jgi:hypothetical protein